MSNNLITKTFTSDGHRYYVRGKTEADCMDKMNAKQLVLIQQKVAEKRKLSLLEWSLQCLDTYKVGVKDSTYESYRTRLRTCITDYIGGIPIDEVTPMIIQQCINHQRGNSKYQIDQTYIMLKFIFDRAVNNDIIKKSPMVNIVKPKGHVTERRALFPDERERFLDIASSNNKYLIFLLMYYTGARSSEAESCMGYDIDHDTKTLHIRGTKTANADRYIPINDNLYQKIKKTMPNELIATSQKGHKFTKHHLSDYWKSLKFDAELPDDLQPYSLRHDFCTRLVNKCSIQEAKYLMGHSDIELLMKVYTHLGKQQVQHISL